MNLSWRMRLARDPSLRDINKWGSFDYTLLAKHKRAGYLRNLAIVSRRLEGVPGILVAKEFGITNGAVSQKMARCLGGDEDKPPRLFLGLIPNTRAGPGKRRAALPTLSKPSGTSHAFRELLKQLPSLAEGLDEFILASKSDSPYAQRLTGLGFFGEFKRLLEVGGWSKTTYPYTTETMARNTVLKYLKEREVELKLELDRQRRAERAQTANPAPPVPRPPQKLRPMRCIEIDAQKYDAEQTVHFEFNGTVFPLRVGRLWLLRAICRDTDATLAFHLAAKREPSTADLLMLFHKMLGAWERPILKTPGLSFTSGANMPSGLSKYYPCVPSEISLDNALIHRGKAIRNLVTKVMMATFTLKRAGEPKGRNVIEHSFHISNQRHSHRIASTTGSHPRDKLREARKNRQQPPAITYDELLETLTVFTADGNARGRAKFSGLSPLEVYEAGLTDHYVPYCPRAIYETWQTQYQYEVCVLHTGLKDRRPPFINALSVRYQGECLYQAINEKHIRIKIFDPDVRSVQAYRLDGRFLGILYAPLSWQLFAHSRDTRRCAHSWARRSNCHREDPLAGFYHAKWEERNHPGAARTLLYLSTGSREIAPWLVETSVGDNIAARTTWTSQQAFQVTQ